MEDALYAGIVDTEFLAKQEVKGVLYDAAGEVVGSMTLKFSKKNKKTSVVKMSASAMMIVGDKAKKVGAKALKFTVDEWLAGEKMKVEFKAPVNAMVLEPDGVRFALGNVAYEMVGLAVNPKTEAAHAVEAGGDLANRPMSFSVDFSDMPKPDAGFTILAAALPTNVTVAVSGGKKLDAGKAASVKYKKFKDKSSGTSWYELTGVDDGAKNLSGLKLTYTPKTGRFKGSFKVYATDESGSKPKLKKYTVKVVGFMADEGSGVFGTGVATCKKLSPGTWSVNIK